MLKNRAIILLILISLIISGCSLNKKEESEKPEILMAQECGMDGLKCCDTDPKCSFGQQCCIDPNDSSRNQCANDCACGKKDAFCCAAGNKCEQGTTCQEGRCIECGKEGQPCCESKIEDNGLGNNDNFNPACELKSEKGTLTCHQNKCVMCGEPGSPCCLDGTACKKPNDSLSECREGICFSCGTNGQESCWSEPHCGPSHLLNNDICFVCGGMNQPCCRDGNEQQSCKQSGGLVCDLGFCRPK